VNRRAVVWPAAGAPFAVTCATEIVDHLSIMGPKRTVARQCSG
jgi:hypothetical protein